MSADHAKRAVDHDSRRQLDAHVLVDIALRNLRARRTLLRRALVAQHTDVDMLLDELHDIDVSIAWWLAHAGAETM
jgi:hypothetical protein